MSSKIRPIVDWAICIAIGFACARIASFGLTELLEPHESHPVFNRSVSFQHEIVVLAIDIIGFLLDPINLVLFLGFSYIAQKLMQKRPNDESSESQEM